MSPQTTYRIRLGQRDHRILRRAGCFRMVTPEVLQVTDFEGKQLDAVRSALRRLCGRPPRYLYLRPEDLDGTRKYYRLTGRGARLIGAPKHCAQRLGLVAKIRRYAELWFICAEKPHARTLFDLRDFPQHFQLHGQRLPQGSFYVEQADEARMCLGYIIVDHGSDPRRICRKACQTMARFLKQGWFDEYLRAGTFVLSVLTVSERKRDDLGRTLAGSLAERLRVPLRQLGLSLETGLPFTVNVVVVPGLDLLIPGLRPLPLFGDRHD
jgi:hypothetical protein